MPGQPAPIDDQGTTESGTLVGIRTDEGVLLAADSRVSDGTVVSSERVQKFTQIHPTAAIGSTGDLGPARSFIRALRAAVDLYAARRGKPMDITGLSTVAAEELRADDSLAMTFVLGGIDDHGSHVFTLSREDGAVEDEYVAVGSGRHLAYAVLDAEVTASITLSEARPTAILAIERAGMRDPKTGAGFYLAEITDDGVDISQSDF